MRRIADFFSGVASRFYGESCLERSAGLSYYAVFAIPALMFLLFRILAATLCLGYVSEQAKVVASDLIHRQASQLISEESIEGEIDRFMSWTGHRASQSQITVLSFIGIILSATGILTALQDSLNLVWKLPTKPRVKSLTFLLQRLFSAGMLIGLALLMTVSFFISTGIDALIGFAFPSHNGATSIVTMHMATTSISLLSQLTIIFLVFYVLPDTDVLAVHALGGALTTNIFYFVGKLVLQHQIMSGELFTQFGSGASLLLILLWLYYSFVSLHLGACVVAELGKNAIAEQESA